MSNLQISQGSNFIDVLFKHILENGIRNVSFTVISNAYLYLSLDKIKESLKFINDYIFKWIYDKAQLLQQNGLRFIIDNIKKNKQLFIGFCHLVYCKMIGKFKRPISVPVNNNTNSLPICDTSNAQSITISYNNKLLLMALCNYFCKNNDIISKFPIIYDNMDNNKHSIYYDIPSNVDFTINDIDIKVHQLANMKIMGEITDNKYMMKNISCDHKNSEFKTMTYTALGSIITEICKNKIPMYYTDIFNDFKIDDKTYSSIGLLHCMSGVLGFLILLTKNTELLLKIASLKNQDKCDVICFDGIKYQLANFLPNAELYTNSEKMEIFKKKLDNYHTQHRVMGYLKEYKPNIQSIKNKLNSLFENTNSTSSGLSITFSTTNLSTNLHDIHKQIINDITNDYNSEQYKQDDVSVSVYQFEITYKEVTSQKPNPEYLKCTNIVEQMKKEIGDNIDKTNDVSDDGKKTNKNNKLNNMYETQKNKLLLIPKEITHCEQIPEPKSTLIKKDKKSLKYLYLNKKNKSHMDTYLTNFKNNKDSYEKYGIRYKGGVLLSGPPGCGKSSTIVAMGTYLNKDIYYLDLGKIKTNKELQLCIDSIRNLRNGAIIVFEDIDCMTQIVSRENNIQFTNNDCNINKIDINDKLSLSYLLNVIDGTLSPENTIFVMTSNYPERLDPALIRHGRIDIHVELTKCTKYQVKKIYQDMYDKKISKAIIKDFPENKFITAHVILHLFHNIYNKNITTEQLFDEFICPNMEKID